MYSASLLLCGSEYIRSNEHYAFKKMAVAFIGYLKSWDELQNPISW